MEFRQQCLGRCGRLQLLRGTDHRGRTRPGIYFGVPSSILEQLFRRLVARHQLFLSRRIRHRFGRGDQSGPLERLHWVRRGNGQEQLVCGCRPRGIQGASGYATVSGNNFMSARCICPNEAVGPNLASLGDRATLTLRCVNRKNGTDIQLCPSDADRRGAHRGSVGKD